MITAVGAIGPRCSTTRTARSAVSPIPSSSSTAESHIDEACEVKPTWNAAVCKGDVGRMNVGGGGGGGGRWRRCSWRRSGGPVALLRCRRRRRSCVARVLPLARSCCPGAPLAVAALPLPQEPEVAVAVAVGARTGRIGDPAQPPVVLSRNGKDFPVGGATNVRAGTEFKVTTERPSVSLSVSELDAGSWVIFELPGFTTAASGTAQTAWMHFARPLPPRTTKATVRFGSSLSPPVTSLAARPAGR